MSLSAHSDRPPTYQQVLTDSQQQLYPHNAPYTLPIPVIPVVQTTTIKFGDRPITMNCPYCGLIITTVIEEENGAIAFLLCILLAIFGFFFGCCLIPFCISDLKDKIHYCPNCQKSIGKKTLL